MDGQGYVTTEEVLQSLKALYREDDEVNLQKVLLRALSDDLKPIDENERRRPRFPVILVGVMILSLLGVFLYFSLGARP